MVFERREYVLKLYDTELLHFSAGVSRYGNLYADIIEADEGLRKALPLPLTANLNSDVLLEWMKSRTIPQNRRFVSEILAQAGLTVGDTLGIIDVCKGLAVTDAYWIDHVGGNENWADVNLFDNELDETLALVAYTGYTSSQHKKLGLSSEWTTSGQFPKAWRRIDGELRLYKGGTEGFANAGMEPYSEYFAHQLASAMGVPSVPYDLDRWKGRLASVCPLLNDRDHALVPFYEVTGQSQFPLNLSITEKMGEAAFSDMRSMIVFDALIYNEDRHAGNYGFLRDNHTGEITGMAPLYDHNLALFARDMKSDYAGWATNAGGKMPRTGLLTFDQQAAMVMGEAQHGQLRHLLDFRFENHPQYPVDQERLDALNGWIGGRVRDLLSMPVVDEVELRRDLQHEVAAVKEAIPALGLDKLPAVDVRECVTAPEAAGCDLDMEAADARAVSGDTARGAGLSRDDKTR